MKITLPILAVCIVVLALVGYRYFVSPDLDKMYFFRNKTSQEILAECSNLMKVTFPPDARLISVNASSWTSIIIVLKVEIRREQLKGFLMRSPFAEQHFQERIHVPNTGDVPTWVEDKPHKFMSGETTLKDKKRDRNVKLEIVVNLDRPDNLTINLLYLVP